jgi:F-type H+-transporting ATPase subunit delta
MSHSIVAKRYAKALFELAEEKQGVSDVEQQLKLAADSLAGDKEILQFFVEPSISLDKKQAVIESSLRGKVSDYVLNTVLLLNERGRLPELGDVYQAYVDIAGDVIGQSVATVYTARKLDEQELAKVQATFSELTGKRIEAQQVVDQSLLGGVKVRIGDRLYDGSLSGKLARLEKSLNS